MNPVVDVRHPFVAFCTHPMCRVSAADCVVMRQLGVSGCVPLVHKVWALAGKGVVGAHSLTRAIRAARPFRSITDGCYPAVWMPIRTLVAGPVYRLAAADCIVMGQLGVPGCVPLLDKVWALVGKAVMGAHSRTRAERAACAVCSVIYSCCPAVLMPIRTLVADPVDFASGLRLDEDVDEVSILFMVPLALQQWAEQADVWALPLRL